MCFWVFHKWAKWEDTNGWNLVANTWVPDGTGKLERTKEIVGRIIEQTRVCSSCGAKELRTVRSEI